MARRPVIVYLLIGLNAAVYLTWTVARSTSAGEPGSLLRFMLENFMVSSNHLAAGHWWTVLTAEFSHIDLWHIALNMIVLLSFGSVLERLWGSRLFTGVYLVAAVAASVAHCAVGSLLLDSADTPAVGASGAISALLIAYALHFPRQKILLFGIVPMPAMIAALLFVGIDLWGLMAQAQGGGLPIGHGAHLGGALCGAVLWVAVLRPRFGQVDLRPQRPAVTLSPEEAQTFERIRDTLERDGVDGLTPKEKAFLDQIRERALGGTSR